MELKASKDGLPILDQFSEEGFIDCVFKIKHLQSEAGHYQFHMAASFNNEVVGVNVQVVKGIKAGFNDNMELVREHVYREGVHFLRSGDESDRLITALAQLYGLKHKVETMVAVETFTGIALHQGDIDLEKETVKIKLFGKDKETDEEDDYYESFFNLDLPNGLVFWNEKDQGYREPLIKALSVHAG